MDFMHSIFSEGTLAVIYTILLVAVLVGAILWLILFKPKSQAFIDLEVDINKTDIIKSSVNVAYYFLIFFIVSSIVSAVMALIWCNSNGYSIDVMNPNSSSYDQNVVAEMENAIGALLELIVYVLAFIPIFILSFKWIKEDFKRLSLNKKKTKWILIGVAMVYGANIVVSIIFSILGIGDVAGNQAAIESMVSTNVSTIIILIITTVFLAPILEELVFRKSIFNLCRHNTKLGLFLSSLIFGLIHVVTPAISAGSYYGFITQAMFLIQYAAMGVAIGLSYVFSNRNIAVSISVHLINNLISMIFLLITFFTKSGA